MNAKTVSKNETYITFSNCVDGSEDILSTQQNTKEHGSPEFVALLELQFVTLLELELYDSP